MSYLKLLFCITILKSSVYFTCLTPQFRLALLQTTSRHMWSVASSLTNVVLTCQVSLSKFWELTPPASLFLVSWIETSLSEKARDRQMKDRQVSKRQELGDRQASRAACRGTGRQEEGADRGASRRARDYLCRRAGMRANLCYLSFTSLP